MINHYLLHILIFVFFYSVSLSCSAFGKLGHQLICQLSFEQLPRAQQSAIVQLLQAMPTKEKIALNRYLALPKSHTPTFAQACTWPDAIKRQPEYEHFQHWHFLNINRQLDNIPQQKLNQENVISGFLYHHQLFSQVHNRWEKLKALLFLSHWLADMHQPLHISYQEDRGGNKRMIKNAKKPCNNLHALWDTCLLRQNNASPQKLYQKLAQQLQQYPLPNTTNIQEAFIVDPLSWADESLAITRDKATKYCQLNAQGYCQVMKKWLTIDVSYYKKHQPVIEQRITIAATRLALYLTRHANEDSQQTAIKATYPNKR